MFLLFKFFNFDLVYIHEMTQRWRPSLNISSGVSLFLLLLLLFHLFLLSPSTFSGSNGKDRNSEAGGQPSSFLYIASKFSCVSAIFFYWNDETPPLVIFFLEFLL